MVGNNVDAHFGLPVHLVALTTRMNRFTCTLVSAWLAAALILCAGHTARAGEGTKAGLAKSVGLRVGNSAIATDVIRSGDTLNLHFPEDASFDGKYQVRPGGYIIIPKVGRVSVAGKTIEAAEAAIRRALATSLAPKPTLMPRRTDGSNDLDRLAFQTCAS
jgi:hypothetical protein